MEPAKSLSSSSSLSPGKRKIEDIRERMANRKRFRDSGGLAVVHPAVAIPVTPSVALILPKGLWLLLFVNAHRAAGRAFTSIALKRQF